VHGNSCPARRDPPSATRSGSSTARLIVKLENGQVTFRWQESATGASWRMTIPVEEFLRRFLQHVLPKGTHKVLYYGLLSPARRIRFKRLQLLLAERVQRKDPTAAAPP